MAWTDAARAASAAVRRAHMKQMPAHQKQWRLDYAHALKQARRVRYGRWTRVQQHQYAGAIMTGAVPRQFRAHRF